MNESYKDKFNAAMKKFGINSLDDLETDADKKKFFKHVDSIHTADHEEVEEGFEKPYPVMDAGQRVKIIKIANKNSGDMEKAIKEIEKIRKGLTDNPDVMDILKRANESLKEEHDCEKEHPGASHESWESKKKLSASYESRKYHDTKPGSIQDTVAQMYANEHKVVTVKVKELSAMVETYLNKGGVPKNLSQPINELWPAIAGAAAVGAAGYGIYKAVKGKLAKYKASKTATQGLSGNESTKLPLQAVREFIDTYNRHFLTNYRAEEFIVKDRLNENQIQEGGIGGYYPQAPTQTPMVKRPSYLPPIKRPVAKRPKGGLFNGDDATDKSMKEETEDEIVMIKVEELSAMVETYLKKGGVIDTTSIDEGVDLDEEINALPLHEVKDFINTYNRYFMTNYKVEEFIDRLNEGVEAGAGIGGGEAKPKKVGTFLKFVRGVAKVLQPPKNFIQGKGWVLDKDVKPNFRKRQKQSTNWAGQRIK